MKVNPGVTASSSDALLSTTSSSTALSTLTEIRQGEIKEVKLEMLPVEVSVLLEVRETVNEADQSPSCEVKLFTEVMEVQPDFKQDEKGQPGLEESKSDADAPAPVPDAPPVDESEPFERELPVGADTFVMGLPRPILKMIVAYLFPTADVARSWRDPKNWPERQGKNRFDGGRAVQGMQDGKYPIGADGVVLGRVLSGPKLFRALSQEHRAVATLTGSLQSIADQLMLQPGPHNRGMRGAYYA
jgi:hypothetical protein